MQPSQDLCSLRSQRACKTSDLIRREIMVDVGRPDSREPNMAGELLEADAVFHAGAPQPRGQEFVCKQLRDIRQRKAPEPDGHHANAGVGRVIGRHAAMLSSVMHSAPLAIASVARSVKSLNTRAVTPSVACSTCRRVRAEIWLGVLSGRCRRTATTRSWNSSSPCYLGRMSSSKRRASWTSPPIASLASEMPRHTSEIFSSLLTYRSRVQQLQPSPRLDQGVLHPWPEGRGSRQPGVWRPPTRRRQSLIHRPLSATNLPPTLHDPHSRVSCSLATASSEYRAVSSTFPLS